MPRLFIGIPVHQHLQEDLQAFAQKQVSTPDIRWTLVNKLHITLYFFAEVPEEMLPNLVSLLQLAIQEAAPFSLEFDKFVLAPPGQKLPRMIWARYKKEAAFVALHHRIHQAFEKIQEPRQIRKSPIPHITLARLRGEAQQNTWQLQAYPRERFLQVKELVLWQSLLTPTGSIYKELKVFQL